jgi:uncharacterized membrane protein (UPF0127 family)
VRAQARLAALALAVACASPKQEPPAAPIPRVVVTSATGAHAVTVEVVRSDEDRARGLMYRTKLEPDAGMLFLFETSEDHSFWMKNTFIPLDMIFIDEGGRIAGVVERAEPHTTASRSVGKPSRYVLEVNGGWAAAHGVRAGDAVKFENVPLY